MSAIIQAIARAFLAELLAAMTGYFSARRDEAQSVALGRAESERDAAVAAARAAGQMNGVALPDDDEMMRRLREGSA